MKSKTTAMQTRLDTEHRRLVQALSLKLDLTMSQVIRIAIRDLARKHGIR